MSRFKKATKEQCKLRLAIFSPSGGGKTMSALRIAKGLAGENGKIALIDTERKSASKYSDRYSFDVLNEDNPTVNNMLMDIDDAKDYDVLIIDSMTHVWWEVINLAEKAGKSKGNNSWAGWSEATPKQKEFINKILSFPGHVIATMRCKTEWAVQYDEAKKKNIPVKLGLAPEQGKGIEYEFDMLMEITQDHFATVTKDRTGKYQDQIIEMPDEEFGKQLAEWLQEGNIPEQKPELPPEPPKEESIVSKFQKYLSNNGVETVNQLKDFANSYGITSSNTAELKRLLDNPTELNEMIQVYLEQKKVA